MLDLVDWTTPIMAYFSLLLWKPVDIGKVMRYVVGTFEGVVLLTKPVQSHHIAEVVPGTDL